MDAVSPAGAPAHEPEAASHPVLRPELLLAAASVAFVVLVLLALEWLVRWANPGYLSDHPEAGLAQIHRYSEVYGWEPRPGAVTFVDGQRSTINGSGLRGAVHPTARSSRPRILLLGDSVAFGYGVADEQTFAARLEERGYEVVNLAVPGYGTDQSLLRLEHVGLAYHPDVVLLHFCLHNDFVDNASRTYFYDGLHPKPYFTLDGGALTLHAAHLHLSPVTRIGLWLHERSHLFNHLVGRPPPVGVEWAARRDAALHEPDAIRDLTFHLILRTAEVARAGGADFALVIHDGRREAREGSPWLEALRTTPLLGSIRRLDMTDRFRAQGLALHDLTLDPIGHLNARGHQQAARVIEDLLREMRAGS